MTGRKTSSGRTTSYRNSADTRSMYVYGNTVTKPDYQEPREKQRPERTKKEKRRARQRQRKALRVNRGYVVFLTVAAVLALIVCVNYVQLQAELTSRSKHITAMQEELADKKEENTTKYNVIMNSVNLAEIRNRAMNDLGMVYANKDQIVEYENSSDNYVKQYEQIPESGVLASSKESQD